MTDGVHRSGRVVKLSVVSFSVRIVLSEHSNWG